MAQIGAWVPAAKCVITPCDRIFARMGANDDLVAGIFYLFIFSLH